MTASQPFSSLTVCADIDRFRHEWVWQKNRGSNFANTIREPFKEHETVLVFSDGKWTYNPQMQKRAEGGLDRVKYGIALRGQSENYRDFTPKEAQIFPDERVPSSVQKFNTEVGLHPTQKPLDLFSYLVLTYSNVGDIIVDPFCGSGTAVLAAKNMGRKAIGIDSSEKYCEIAVQRLAQEVMDFGDVA